MILIDSSVWIYYYRPTGPEKIKETIKEAIASDLVAINGIILVEILSGISKKEDFKKVSSDFKGFHLLPLNEEIFMEASALGSSLRRKGITIPATDLIIASSALKAECSLCHIDFHFDTIATHVSLKATNFKRFID